MKNMVKFFGIIAFAAIIGFTFAACDTGGGAANGGSTQTGDRDRDQPTVTSVTVALAAVPVMRGEYQDFTVTVQGSNNPTTTVTWSVEGNQHTGTTISNTGRLSVHNEEALGTITVRAISTFNTAISGTATVTVTNIPPVVPNYTLPPVQTATFGQTLSQISLPAGWAWVEPNTLVGNVGTRTHSATYTRIGNYLPVTRNITVIVEPSPYAYFTWTQVGEVKTITGWTGTGNSVVIPATIYGIPVTAIGEMAFAGPAWNIRGQLTSVTIPDSVTRIETGAFAFNNLTSVTIPSSVTRIEAGAFARNNLTSVTIPNSVTFIGGSQFLPGGAFSNNNLTSVNLGNSVTSIGNDAFSSNNLTSVTIPNSVTSLSGFGSNNLNSVIIPNSVTFIGNRAFNNNQITSVIIPNSVTVIEEASFANNQLTSVTIPNSVNWTGGAVFYNNNLTSVTIPNSLTWIGNSMFANNNLTSVTIPHSVTYIGQRAFMNNNLTSVTIGNAVSLGINAFPPGNRWDIWENNFNTVYGGVAGTFVRALSSNVWTRQ